MASCTVASRIFAFAVVAAPLLHANALTLNLKMNEPHQEDQVESAEEARPQRKFSLIESDVESSPIVNQEQGSPFKNLGNSQSPSKVIGDSQSPLQIRANPLRIENLRDVIQGSSPERWNDQHAHDDLHHRYHRQSNGFAGIGGDFDVEDHLQSDRMSKLSNKFLNRGSYVEDNSRTGPVTNNSKLQSIPLHTIPGNVPIIPEIQSLLGVGGQGLHSVHTAHTPHAPQTSISNPMMPVSINPLLDPRLQKTATNKLLQARLLIGNQFTTGNYGNYGIQEPAFADMTYTLRGINETVNDEDGELAQETLVRHNDEEGEEELESPHDENDVEHDDRNNVEHYQPEAIQQRNEAPNEEQQRLQRGSEIQNPANCERHNRRLSEESENVEAVEEPREHAGKLGKMSMIMMPRDTGKSLQKMTEIRNQTLSARATGKLQKMTEHRNETLHLRATGKLQKMIEARDPAREQDGNESFESLNEELCGAKIFNGKQGKDSKPKAIQKQTVNPEKNPHKQMSKQISEAQGLATSGVKAVKHEVRRVSAHGKKTSEPFRGLDRKLLPRQSALQGREAIKDVVDILRKKPEEYSDDEGPIPMKVSASSATNPAAPQPETQPLPPNHPPNPAHDDVSVISLLPSLTVSLSGENESKQESDHIIDNLEHDSKQGDTSEHGLNQENEQSDGLKHESDSSQADNRGISKLNRQIQTSEQEIAELEADNVDSDSNSMQEDQEQESQESDVIESDFIDEANTAMLAPQNDIGHSFSEARSSVEQSSVEHADTEEAHVKIKFECTEGCKRTYARKSVMTKHSKDCNGVSIEARKQIEALLDLEKFRFVCKKPDETNRSNTQGGSCLKRFSSQRELDQHQKYRCDDEFFWKCDNEGCDQEFRTQGALGDHQVRKHKEVAKRKYPKNRRTRTHKKPAIMDRQEAEVISDDELKCRELFYACLVPTLVEQQSSDEDAEDPVQKMTSVGTPAKRKDKKIEGLSKEAGVLKEGVGYPKKERVHKESIKVKIPLQTGIDQDSTASRKPLRSTTYVCPPCARPDCVRRLIKEPYLCTEGEFMWPESDCKDGKCSWQDLTVLTCDIAAWWAEAKAAAAAERAGGSEK